MASTARAPAFRAILVLAVACAGLATGCVILWLRAREEGGGGRARAELAMSDPELRRQAVQELVARGAGIWDAFPDPEVARLLQPSLKSRDANGFHVTTNDLGLRERPFALPKPAGTTRVVLLGDSFVLGQGVEQEERLGVFLERALAERAAGPHGPIEVLHFGASGWNIRAECAFVRRQLSLLQPDLVIQIVVRNDLDDNYGTRGFGELGNFDPLHLERGEGIFHQAHATTALQGRLVNWIACGLDHESRSRYELAEAAIAGLAAQIAAIGGRYLLVDWFAGLPAVARHFLARRLRPEQLACLPSDLIEDDRYRIGKDDLHWNRAGHELVAKLLYSMIRERALVPGLALAAWPDADGLAADWWKRGAVEAAAEPDFVRLPPRRSIAPGISFARLDEDAKAQVHGGLFLDAAGEGVVAPYAAVILRAEGRRALVIHGAGLGRHELDDARVDVFVDYAKVGTLASRGNAAIDARFDVPAEIAQRTFVSARLVSSDYAYGGADLRIHVVMRLQSIGLE